MADTSFNLQYTATFLSGTDLAYCHCSLLVSVESPRADPGFRYQEDGRRPGSVDQSDVPPEGFKRIPNYSPPVSAFEANASISFRLTCVPG